MTGRAARAIRAGALWCGALALVLALHLGGALWIMRQAEAAAPPGLPEPVFVDLVPAETTQEPDPRTDETVPEPSGTAAETPAAPEPPPPPEPEPEPDKVAEPLSLPPLPELMPLDTTKGLLPPALTPVELPPPAALTASARPERRPERTAVPPRERESRQDARRDPEPQRQSEPRRQEQPAPRQQQARQAPQGAAGSGSTGPNPRQKASLMAQWGGQIRACISRRASAPRGVREGGRVTLALTVSRSGSIERADIAGSSGNRTLDQAAVQAAQRAGRCPRAPAGLTEASYGFKLPIDLQIR